MLRKKQKPKPAPAWHHASMLQSHQSSSSTQVIDLTSDTPNAPSNVKGPRLKRRFAEMEKETSTSNNCTPFLTAINTEARKIARPTTSSTSYRFMPPVTMVNTIKIDPSRAVRTSHTSSNTAQNSPTPTTYPIEDNISSKLTGKVWNSPILEEYQRQVKKPVLQSPLSSKSGPLNTGLVQHPEYASFQRFNYLPLTMRGPLDAETYNLRSPSPTGFEVESVAGEVEDIAAEFEEEQLLLPSQLFDFGGADSGDENLRGHSDHDGASILIEAVEEGTWKEAEDEETINHVYGLPSDSESASSYSSIDSVVGPTWDNALRSIIATDPQYYPSVLPSIEVPQYCPPVLPSIEVDQHHNTQNKAHYDETMEDYDEGLIIIEGHPPTPRPSPLPEYDSSAKRRRREMYSTSDYVPRPPVPTTRYITICPIVKEESQRRMLANIASIQENMERRKQAEQSPEYNRYYAGSLFRLRSPSEDSVTLCGDGYEADKEDSDKFEGEEQSEDEEYDGVGEYLNTIEEGRRYLQQRD